MGEPCVQEGRVSTLETALEAISDSLVELKETAKETYKVLADISKQGAEIGALSSRMDKHERVAEQMTERIRSIDETIVIHSAFISQHDRTEGRDSSLKIVVVGGLVVVAVVAVVTFMIWMVDVHNYTQTTETPLAKAVKAAIPK